MNSTVPYSPTDKVFVLLDALSAPLPARQRGAARTPVEPTPLKARPPVPGVQPNVTEREPAVQLPQDSELRYRALFEAMDEGFCVIEVLFDDTSRPFDYRFVEVNPAFEKHTGLPNAVGRTALELVPGLEPFWIETYGRVASTGTPARFNHHVELLGRWYDVYAFRLGDVPRGRVAVLFNDISERLAAQASREALMARLREQDARKEEFLATLAHELRNPLAPLLSGLRLLDRSRDDAATWDHARAMMERQVDLLVRLINDLLDTARINRGQIVLRRAPVTLSSVVQRAAEVSQPLIDLGGHELVLELPSEPLVLEADEVRLAQVFSNLLSNAAKYSERGGRIVLSMKLTDHGREVQVRVRDQGIGIAPDMVSRVFDLYAQVDASLEKSQGGLGIGLTLARSLVELHGGSVQVRSEGLGCGSEFIVTLPMGATQGHVLPQIAPPAVASPADAAKVTTAVKPHRESTNAATSTTSSRRVLIADDNVDAADSLAALLRIHDHDVRAVYDGRSAIEQLEAYRPDLVLLDLGMPGLDGLDACRSMRALESGQRARIVAVTGWGDEKAQRRCRDAGFDDWMIKPVDDAVLEKMLNGLTAR